MKHTFPQMGHWKQQQRGEARRSRDVDHCECGEDGGREGAGDLPVEPADQVGKSGKNQHVITSCNMS